MSVSQGGLRVTTEEPIDLTGFLTSFKHLMDTAAAQVHAEESPPVFLGKLRTHFGTDPIHLPTVLETFDKADHPNLHLAVSGLLSGDDWVVPYIGDLLATRLVACLDAPAQRLDVAKTIYYRRRSGTLGLLEELTYDIARRDARAVEFFRRLGRTRHQFDPPIGNVFLSAAPAWAGATDYVDGQVVINAGNAYQCVAAGQSNATGGPTGTGTSIPDGGATAGLVTRETHPGTALDPQGMGVEVRRQRMIRWVHDCLVSPKSTRVRTGDATC